MRVSVAGLLLLIVSLARTDNSFYDGEYSYDDNYDVDGTFEYPDESHDYPDQDQSHQRSRERIDAEQPDYDQRYRQPTYEDIPTRHEVNGHETQPEAADDGHICAQSCSARADDDVVYEAGKQYRYQYHGDVVSRSRSTNSEVSRMSVRSYVIITARTQCDLKLQVLNLVLDDVPAQDSKWFKDSVEKYDLHFSYNNGMISYLCPNEEEEVVATNFKRGILSAIQSKMTNMNKAEAYVYEADVLGECETEYHLSEPSELVVNKTKHNCRHNNYLPYIPNEHYSRRELTSEPPFHSSEQTCMMHLQDRVWNRVECVEEMAVKEFRDFFSETGMSSSNSDSHSSLASISISTTLALEAGPEDSSESFTEDGPRKRRESLRMDLEGAIESADSYKHQDSDIKEQITVSMEYLMASVSIDSGLSEKRPHVFSHLVTLIGQLEEDVEIDEVWDTYFSQQTSRQFLLDAAVLCESRACMKLLTRLAVETPEAFPETRVAGWLTGVHFHTHPHPESVDFLVELARNNMAIEHQAVMAASSVVYRLCQQNRFNCRSNAQSLLDYVKEKVGESCGYGESSDVRLQVKLALRALSNAGILPEEYFPRKCYMNKLMTPAIRMAALDTYRRVPCDDLDLDTPWQVLEDSEDDVGVRITAYLSMVRCAPVRPKFFTRVKNLLHKEEVNQVATYLWTHVRNLADKPDGNTRSRELSRLANHHTLQAKFNANSFRSSQNYRVSQFSKLMNIGASIDSNLIFTPESYIPRYETHTFHLDFLENSFDAFEFGGEFKGLEEHLETLFGTEGYFANEDIRKVMETFRPKRDIHDEKIQEFQRMYDESMTMNELEEGEEAIKTSMYFRVFGNEIFYMDNIYKINPWMFIQQLVQEFSAPPRSFQILKQEFVSPTLLGFPLRFRVNATGSVTYDHTGDFTMTSMANFNLEGQVSASAAVSMDETIMVEGYGSSSGIRRRSTHVANTEFGGKVEVKNGKVVDVQFNIPRNELARVSSSVKVSLYENFKQGWNEEEYEGPTERSEFCLPDEMSRMTGLDFCSTSEQAVIQTESEVTMQGDIYSAEYTLTKSDSFDFYKFYFRNQGNNYKLMFDTPGSTVERNIELEFKMRPGNAQGTFTIPGKSYDLEGTYENTETLKKVSLKYREDSTVQGEISFSLPMTQEEAEVMYSPRFFLNLNNLFELDMDGSFRAKTDDISLEGNIKCSVMDNPVNFKASWERNGDQHKIEGNVMEGDRFGTTTGTLFLNGEKTLIQVETEYGTDRNQPNTFALTFDKSLQVVEEGVRNSGYLLIESSVGNTNMELEYDYDANHAVIDTNVTFVGTEVMSHVTVKNEGDAEERNLEVTLSFASPQLDVDYLAQAIYKVADHAFQGEVEVTLGPTLNTKVALNYLFDNDPLHVQGGVHFHLNDFVVQFVHEIDFSQPDVFIITSSDIVGPAAGVLQVEVYYDRMSPFNATFDIHAGYGNTQIGVKAFTSSDEEWSHFEGSAEARWFEWTYSVEHELQWEQNKRQLILSGQEGHLLDIMLQMDPDFSFQFMVQQDPNSDPDLKYGIERRMEGSTTTYQTYLQSYEKEYFHLTAIDMGDNSYNGKAKFLTSQVDLNVQFVHNDDDNMEAVGQATLTFPSGDTFTQRIDFKHTYDGQTREVMFSSHYDEEVIEGQFMMMHKDGWFTDDTRKATFTFTSPFDGLKKIGMAFETHSDWAEPWFAETEWEDIKVRGEMQLGDVTNLEAKIQYEDGGSCDSILHFYHKYDGQHYLSGAILGITKAHDPWAIEIITTEGDNDEEQSLDLTLTFQSPMLQTPYEMKVRYKLSNTHFSLEYEAGSESKTKVSFSGENETVDETRKLLGALNFDLPWAEPVFFNVENLQDSGSFNVSVDLRTSWEHINTVGAELSVNYGMPEETVTHFYLTQQNLQMTMEMIHKLTDKSLEQKMQGSVNSMILNYDLNAKWDEDFIPGNSEGHFTINGLFDHNLEFSFSHKKEESRSDTQLTGSWDLYTVQASHMLEFDHPLKWTSTFELNLPEDKVVMTRLFLNSQRDLSSLESTFYFNSSWTEGFTANLEIHGEDRPTEYNIEATYGDTKLFNVMLQANDSIHWDKTDFAVEVSSSVFDNCKLVWQHDFNSEHLIAFEFSYGQVFHIDGKSHLRHKQGFFSQEFEGYEFALNLKMMDPQIHFKTNFGLDDLFFGELQVSWYEYLLFIKSSIPDNIVFAASLSYPGEHFHTELLYEKRESIVPDFSFRFTRNDIDLFTFKGEFSPVYPEFDALFSLYYFDEYTGITKNAKFQVKADLSHIEEYTFKGMMKLDSDIEGFESYQADIETGMNFTDNFEGHVHGQLHAGYWHFKTELDCLVDLYPNFQIEYNSAYELTYDSQPYDKKELNLKYSHSRDGVVEGHITTSPKVDSPTYSVFINFNKPDMEFKVSITPGNEKKYELILNMTENTLRVNAQRVDEQDVVFNALRGNISWNIKKVKKQITFNFTSDIAAMKKITGQLTIQQRKGFVAVIKLRVNNEDLTGSLKLIGRGKRGAGKIVITIKNNILVPFTTNTIMEYSMKPNEVTGNLKMDVNGQKDWAKASVKGSMSESYIRFNLPFDQFKDFDLSVTLETETQYGLSVDLTGSLFCFSINGSLSKFFDVASLSSTFDWKCSGNPIYDFGFKYNFGSDEFFEAGTHLKVKNFGTLFKFEISGEQHTFSLDNIKIETEIYPSYYHTTTINAKQEDNSLSFQVQTKETSSEETLFLFKIFLSDEKHELEIEVLDTKVISLSEEHSFSESSNTIDANFSHSIFGYSFNAKLTVNAVLSPDTGNLELHLSTDGSFDHADFTLNYDNKKDFQGHFNLETSNGNAEGKATIEKTDTMSHLKADMQSNLHTFENYKFEVLYEYPDNDRKLNIKSIQDEVEFEINCSKTTMEDMAVLSMEAKLPFEKFNSFEISIGYPEEEESSDHSYKGKVGFMLSNEQYELYGKHMHHESWRQQETRFSISTPLRVFGNYGASFMYNMDGQTSFHFENYKGQFGLDGSWEITDTNVVVEFNTDLSSFNQGEYKIKVDIPLRLYEKGEFEFHRHQTDLDFNVHLQVDNNYRNGECVLNIQRSEDTETYSINYKYKNRLIIEGQWDKWNISAKARFTGRRVALTSGQFDVTTNVEGFETINGSWAFQNKKGTYSAKVSFDFNEKGSIRFDGSFSPQPKGMSSPWQSVILEMNFDSFFTKLHKLNAEYSLPDSTMAVVYQYGSETFEINYNLTVMNNNKFNLVLSGNLPINGISTFNLMFEYDYQNSFIVSLKMHIEETFLNVKYESASSWITGHTEVSWSSPFTNNLDIVLKWSFDNHSFTLEWRYGMLENGRINLEYSDTSAHFNLKCYSSFTVKNSQLAVMYDFSDSNDVKLSVELKMEDDYLKLESGMMNASDQFVIKATGSMDWLKSTGSMNFELKSVDDSSRIEFSGQMKESEKLFITTHVTREKLQFNLKYGNDDIMAIRLNFTEAEVNFAWEDLYFNMTSLYKQTGNKYEIDYSLQSSEMHPLSIKAVFNAQENYEGMIKVRYGEKEYNVNGSLSMTKRSSSLDFRFESSVNPYHPIVVSAMYNISDFMQGRMRSESDLALVSFEWGEKIQFSLKGQRRGKLTKLNMKMTTPFDSIPELHFGYQGNLIKRGPNIDLNFTAFFEWSEKVTMTGLFRFKNNRLNSKLTLTTPYSVLENVSFTLLHNDKHVEASLIFNDNEWKIACDYEFSPMFSLSLTAETPVDGFRETTLKASAGFKDNKFSANAKLLRENINAIEMEIIAEMWNLEIHLDTPWEPLKDASFVTSLRTESEELMYTLALKWSSTVTDLKFVYSPIQVKLVGRYVVDDDEIGTATFECHLNDSAFDFSSKLETPFENFKTVEVTIHLNFEESKLTITMPFLYDFNVTMEAKNYWQEMNLEGSVHDPQGKAPYAFKMNYTVEPQNYAISAAAEVASDITWVSVDIDLIDEWRADANIYDNMISMNLTHSDEEGLLFGFSIAPMTSDLESLDLLATFSYSDVRELDGSGSLKYKLKNQKMVKHELKWQDNVDNSLLSLNFRLNSDLLELPYDLKVALPISNIFENDGKFEATFSRDEEELYKFSYAMTYPQSMTFSHVIMVQFPDWTAELSASLTRSNFEVSFFFPDESTKHSLIVSWPQDISLEKLTFQVDLSTPYLKEGDVNFLFNFSVQQRFFFTVTSSLSYGTNTIEMNGKFQYKKRERAVEIEAAVTSDWIGNYSVNCNLKWARNITGTCKIMVMDQEHTAKLMIDKEEYTAELIVNSPWISSEEVKVTGMVNKDIDSYNILIETKLETDNNDYSIEGKFESTDENYVKAYFIMKRRYEHILNLSGLFQLKDNLVDLDFKVRSDVIDISSIIKFRYEDTEERRSITVNLENSYSDYANIYVDIFNSKNWRGEQRLSTGCFKMGSFRYSITLGEEEGEIEFNFLTDVSKFHFEIEYDISKEFELEVHLQTPFNNAEMFDFELEWPLSMDSEKEITIYYQWYDDNISFKFNLMPDSITGWSVGSHLTTPFEGYERFGFQTPQLDSDKVFNMLIEYPDGKVGLELHNNCRSSKKCQIDYSLHLPFEEYEIISLKFDTLDFDGFGIETRVGKIGFTLDFGFSRNTGYSQFDTLIRVNEYRTESYLRVYDLRDRFRCKFHADFEMHDISEIKFFDFESRYDRTERILIVAETDQGELVKVHMGWGIDKVVAITTPKVYPGYLILNLESTEDVDDYKVEVGLSKRDSITWEKYGFHIQQKQLGYGRDIKLSGEAGESQFSIDGTITLNPFYNDNFYIKQSFTVELNHKKLGFVTYFQTDFGFFEDSFNGDLQIILPEQTLHWDTNATCTGGRFDMLSQFRWNDFDAEEEPITLTIDYDDLSATISKEHTLLAVFSHPQIQNMTLQGKFTHTENSELFATVEFIDENDLQRNILFKMSSAPNPEEEGACLINANITQPSSNFVIEFNAEIKESVFNQASYGVNYWSHSKQKWEVMNLTTSIESVNHGWHFNANLNKPDSTWGYNYNGSLLHQEDSFSLNFMGASEHFMDYWRLETSVNKYLPELDMQLQVGQSKLKPHEIGRVRVGLHNPLEMGIIIDHERFGVWRQDARAGFRLRNQDLLQFVAEYDPTFDFMDESLVHRMTSPANKISNAWLRDFSYTASAFQKWASSEIPAALGIVFNQYSFQTMQHYGANKYIYFEYAITSSFTSFYRSFSETYTQNVKPILDSFSSYALNMYAVLQPYFESSAFVLWDNWSQMLEVINIEYVRLHDRFIMDVDRFYLWWTETSHEMDILFNNIMYEMVRAMNTCSNAMTETLHFIQDTFGPKFESYRMEFERYGQELEAIFGGQCWSRIQQEMDKITASLAEVMYMAEQFIQPEEYFIQMRNFRDRVVDCYTHTRDNFEGGMSQLQEALSDSTLFGKLMDEYEQVKSFAHDVISDGFYVTFQRRFAEMGPQLLARADETLHALRVKYNDFQEYSRGNIFFDYFEAVTGNAFHRLTLTWEQWRANEYQLLATFQRFVVSFVDTFKNLVQEGASLTEESIVFEPKTRGKIVYNQYLPVPWNNFLEAPQWFRLVNLFQKESPMLESKRKLAEGFDNFRSIFGSHSMQRDAFVLLPFTATATVYGQQITTFDLLNYQFLGSCSYLMTKDFVGGDFEVIGEYTRFDDGEIRITSMIIKTHGDEVTLRVDGTHDANLNVRGAEEDGNRGTPQVYVDDTHVAFKQDGLLVTCNKVSQGCSVTVSNKYFGRLAGLFGNYNNEPSDDSKGPDGSKAEDGNDIANNWAVSSASCYQANQVRTVTELKQVSDYGNCHEIFLRSSSPFSRCFLAIDPRPHFWHCLRDHNRAHYNPSPCDSATAYRTQCFSEGIHMPPLHQCHTIPEDQTDLRVEEVEETPIERSRPSGHVEAQVPVQRASATCDVSGDSKAEGWSKIYEAESQGSADVAFVIEVANCNKDRKLQLLLKLVKVQLKRAGIQDVRYALVTTQGDSVDIPLDMVSEEDLNTQLGNLVLGGPKSVSGGAYAVKEAARQLKWRPGVVRNIIHLPCRACNDGQAVTEALSENDVIYHIITKFKSVMDGPNAKKSKAMADKVYGFDSKRIYTPKDTKKFSGNAQMRKLFQEPEDSSCFEAVQTSGGSVFNINKWTSKSAVVEKKFLGVVGQRIAKSGSAPECQECRCLREGDEGKVSCRKCGEDWPAVEVQQVQTEQRLSQESEVQGEYDGEEQGRIDSRRQDRRDESESVLEDIRKSFKKEFIEENAAFEHLGQNQQDSDGERESDPGHHDDHGEDEEQVIEEEEQVIEEEEQESEESEEEYDESYQYEDYSY